MHHPTHMIAHTTAFISYTSRGALAGTRNGSVGPPSKDLLLHLALGENRHLQFVKILLNRLEIIN